MRIKEVSYDYWIRGKDNGEMIENPHGKMSRR